MSRGPRTQDPDDILNWRRVTARISTSGQPSDSQMAALKAIGVTHVINLGPHDNAGALADEPGTVTALGMTYVSIPVVFEAPTEQDYTAFKAELERHARATLHVHCIYNARVSAFFYRYARETGLLCDTAAFERMDSIWRPGHDWAAFLRMPEALGRRNRYAGDDY